jgi:hypothetical protein
VASVQRYQSARFTAASLNAWRVEQGLLIGEMAWVFGIPIGTLKDKLYGRSGIRLRMERAVEMTELLLHAGIRPPGWPARLDGRIHANILGYGDDQSAAKPDFSPEQLSEKRDFRR